jgi:hypothetical protein
MKRRRGSKRVFDDGICRYRSFYAVFQAFLLGKAHGYCGKGFFSIDFRCAFRRIDTLTDHENCHPGEGRDPVFGAAKPLNAGIFFAPSPAQAADETVLLAL